MYSYINVSSVDGIKQDGVQDKELCNHNSENGARGVRISVGLSSTRHE